MRRSLCVAKSGIWEAALTAAAKPRGHAGRTWPAHLMLATGSNEATQQHMPLALMLKQLQAEKIEQLNRQREAERQERLRRLQPVAVPAAVPADGAELEQAR